MFIGNLLGSAGAGGGDTGIRENNEELVIATTEITGEENTEITTTVLGTQIGVINTAITAGAITWSITKDGTAVAGVSVNATGQIEILNTTKYTASGDFILTAEGTGQYKGKATGTVKITLTKQVITGYTTAKTAVTDLVSNIVLASLTGGEVVTAVVTGNSSFAEAFNVNKSISINNGASQDHSSASANEEEFVIVFNRDIKLTVFSCKTGRQPAPLAGEFWKNYSAEFFSDENLTTQIGTTEAYTNLTAIVQRHDFVVPANDTVRAIRLKGEVRSVLNVGFNNINIGHDTNFFT